MTTLVTFLGTGNYVPLEYVWNDQRFLTPYVAHALEHFFQPIKAHVLATEEAEQKHGAALAEALSVPSRFIRIPEGGDPETLREQFAIFLDALNVPRDEPLIADITHGFRAQPFFAATALAILQAADRLPEDTRIVYGAAPTPPKEGDEAPIWELTPFLHRLQEAFGIITFLRTGDASLLIEALDQADKRLRKRAVEHGENPRAIRTMGLIAPLKQFATEMQLMRIPALTIGIGDPKERLPGQPVRWRESSSRRLLTALQEYSEACQQEHPALALLLKEIEQMVEPLVCDTLSDARGHKALLHLARLFYDWGQYAEAANVAREGLVCLYTTGPEGTDASRSVYSKMARQAAERCFTSNWDNQRLAKIRNVIEHCDFREYDDQALEEAKNWRAARDAHPLELKLKTLLNEFERQIKQGPRPPEIESSQPAGRTILVTRHAGARDWAERQGIVVDEMVEHLDPETINPGDLVIGTLPVHLAAEICRRGGRYKHLSMNIPPEHRGRELSADDMEKFCAKLEEFIISNPKDETKEP